MPRYTAPQRTPRQRRSLSRRTLIVLAAGFLVPASLLAIAKTPAHAAPSNNPIFATLQDVQNAINAALAPIQNAIADLQTQQSNQAAQISNLQNSTGKQFKVYDANGQEIGPLVNHSDYTDTIYSTALSKFIYIADNENVESADDNSSPQSAGTVDTGIGNKIGYLWYTSSDCTGTPYDNSYRNNANNVMTFSPTEYYIFHTLEPPTTITIGSYKHWNSTNSDWNASHGSLICTPFPNPPSPGVYWQLYPVSLPYSTPIAEPLQFKYQ